MGNQLDDCQFVEALANTLLAKRISITEAIYRVSEATGADASVLAVASGHEARKRNAIADSHAQLRGLPVGSHIAVRDGVQARFGRRLRLARLRILLDQSK